MGHKAKWEYFRAVYERYRKAGREAKHLMLNEFCLNTRLAHVVRARNKPFAALGTLDVVRVYAVQLLRRD